MFLDFALLVEQQGELLDQIEYQVKGAANYVEEGTVQVRGAGRPEGRLGRLFSSAITSTSTSPQALTCMFTLIP